MPPAPNILNPRPILAAENLCWTEPYGERNLWELQGFAAGRQLHDRGASGWVQPSLPGYIVRLALFLHFLELNNASRQKLHTISLSTNHN